jgi:hypothetical protein
MAEDDGTQFVAAAKWLLRCVIGLNFLLFGLSFSPAFEGDEHTPGAADWIFNPHHTNGFRADFIWLVVTTILIFGALCVSVPRMARSRSARVDVALSALWIVAFIWYVERILMMGLLDFG